VTPPAPPPSAPPSSTQPSDQRAFIEFFCGAGTLTRACLARSLQCCAISHAERDEAPFPLVQFDLPLAWAQLQALEVIACDASLPAVWLAPPTATLSFARERPLSAIQRARGMREARPIRSTIHILGLPEAKNCPKIAKSLEIGNGLVNFTFTAVRKAASRGAP
jgi:hypothetical protein